MPFHGFPVVWVFCIICQSCSVYAAFLRWRSPVYCPVCLQGREKQQTFEYSRWSTHPIYSGYDRSLSLSLCFPLLRCHDLAHSLSLSLFLSLWLPPSFFCVRLCLGHFACKAASLVEPIITAEHPWIPSIQAMTVTSLLSLHVPSFVSLSWHRGTLTSRCLRSCLPLLMLPCNSHST